MRERRLRRQRELLVLAAQHAEQRAGSRRAPRARCPRPLRTPARRRRAACARAARRRRASATIEASASLTRWCSSPAIRARSSATAPAARASRSSSAAARLARASAWLSFTRARTSRPSRIGPPTTIVGDEEEVTGAARWMVEADRDRQSATTSTARPAWNCRPSAWAPSEKQTISVAKNGPTRFASTGVAQALQQRSGPRRRPRRAITGARRRTASAPASARSAARAISRSRAGRVDEQHLDLHLHAQRERQEQVQGCRSTSHGTPTLSTVEGRVWKSASAAGASALPPCALRGRVPPRIRVKVLYEIAAAVRGRAAGRVARRRRGPRRRCASTSSATRRARPRSPTCSRRARCGTRASGSSIAAGQTVLRGRVGNSRGRWNRRYRAVQPLDLSALRTPGPTASASRRARSPRFRDRRRRLFAARGDTVAFFQAQRDGADVIAGPLHRRHRPPATTPTRTVYAPPRYDGPDSDVIRGRSLKRDRRAGRRSRAAGSTPATSSSSPTRPPTPRRCCCRPARAGRRGAGDARARGALRARLARQGLAGRRDDAAPGRHRLGQHGAARSTATTTCGGCRRRTTA